MERRTQLVQFSMRYSIMVTPVIMALEDGSLFHGLYFQSMASKTPAATAEPITPDTFGPMACISR